MKKMNKRVGSALNTAEKPITEPNQIAGFWRRLSAFLLDRLILALIGIGLGLILYDYFESLGELGRIMGAIQTDVV